MILNISSKTLVVLDLDDTLYQEYDFVKSAYYEIATSIQGDSSLLYEKMLKWFEEKENVFEKLRELHPAITFDFLISSYRNHIPAISTNEGVIPFLDSLKKYNAIMALITDGRKITQQNKIDALNIRKYFTEIFISEEINSAKNSGKAFKLLDEKYPGYQKISIGDNVHKDFAWPELLGWTTIGLKNQGNNIHSQQESENSVQPHYYINSFAELSVTYEQ
jgi:putative hydrolase of the HAD superfamily